MIQLTCIQKVRDKNGKIISYALQDTNGQQQIFEPHKLKYAIMYNEIVVDNLKMTSDGRLIDRTKDEQPTDRIIKVDISHKISTEHYFGNRCKLIDLLADSKIKAIAIPDTIINGMRLPTVRIRVTPDKCFESISELEKSQRNTISRNLPDGTAYIDIAMQTELLKDTQTGNMMIDTDVIINAKDSNENIIQSDYVEQLNKYINARLDLFENKITVKSKEMLSRYSYKEWISKELNNIQKLMIIAFKECAIAGNTVGEAFSNIILDKAYKKMGYSGDDKSVYTLREHTLKGNVSLDIPRPASSKKKSQGLFNKFSKK